MTNLLTSFLMEDKSYKEILDHIEGSQYIHGMSEESLPHFIYSIFENTGKNILLLSPEENKAKGLAEDLKMLLGERAQFFPRPDVSFHEIESVENGQSEERLAVLNKLASGQGLVISASADALVRKLTPFAKAKDSGLIIKAEEDLDIDRLAKDLVSMAYKRVKRVGGKGEFALRGGIIDIFPASMENPVRIELFDVEIDSMRSFDIYSQRSIGDLDQLEIYPAQESILNLDEKQSIAEKLEEDLGAYDGDKRASLEDKFLPIIDKLNEGREPYNIDLVMGYAGKKSYDSIFEYFDGLVVYNDLDNVFERLSFVEEKYMEDLTYQMSQGLALKGMEGAFYKKGELLRKAKKSPTLNINLLKKRLEVQKPDRIGRYLTTHVLSYGKNYPGLVDEVKTMLEEGYRVFMLTGNANLAHRLAINLEKEGLDPIYEDQLAAKSDKGELIVSPLSMAQGAAYESAKAIFFTAKEIYGKKKSSKQKKKKASESLSVSDLSIDDYVVHENHGIGIYKGLEEMEVSGVRKDYLILEYKGTDRLFIPTEQMDLIQRYVGATDKKPQLNKLGSPAWAKTKARAKKVVSEIAEGLVRLYAERSQEKGFAFSKDSHWQEEFEAAFPFEETEAQLRAIKEIKEDMESDKPMDRILLGDVGFGKTEVAIRSCFKAIMDGKQVAFLVPTTILAQQHYNNIKARMKDFPVNVDMVSRFRTKGQQKDTLKKLRDGQVDLIIGTHRLLSEDVKYKDLGLLVIDEEQRFGVRDKEKLKSIKKNIDVLTLSATPIPRTLQMGLVGIRDMSFLDEGPKKRQASSVYVLEFDPHVIRDAIYREMARSGQVYFVYNRVADMEDITRQLQSLVPEASIATAHGQMSERALEKLMVDFAAGHYDILVSTSIIETGMDIHNVNTIIIYNADHMGLSQLYQLKGRIGRSERSSYAYFTYRPGKALTEISEKRLKAIRDFTDHGSGLKIAMRDLELRGSGNILGESQSGHIDSIGYDLYMKYLEEAINKKQNDQEEITDVIVDVAIDAYIPSSYIDSTEDKVEIYKKVASVSSLDQFYDIIDELTDRFSDPPEAVVNTVKISLLKNLASKLGIIGIRGTKGELAFLYKTRDDYGLEDLEKLTKAFSKDLVLDLSKNPSFVIRSHDFNVYYDFLQELKDLRKSKLEKADEEEKSKNQD